MSYTKNYLKLLNVANGGSNVLNGNPISVDGTEFNGTNVHPKIIYPFNNKIYSVAGKKYRDGVNSYYPPSIVFSTNRDDVIGITKNDFIDNLKLVGVTSSVVENKVIVSVSIGNSNVEQITIKYWGLICPNNDSSSATWFVMVEDEFAEPITLEPGQGFTFSYTIEV